MSGKGPAAAASRAICAYRPRSVSETAGAFARQVVGQAQPATPARARTLLFCASRLAAFGESLGLAPQPAALLADATIERFLLQGAAGFSPATRRTLASGLRALCRGLDPSPNPPLLRLGRERAKPPYSEAEIEGFLAAAKAQSTEARRMRATALICLGAGAGVVGSELRPIRGSDVVERYGGVAVSVSGARARIAPVLWRFQAPLLEAARFGAEGYLLGGRSPARRNLTCQIAAALRDPCLPRLDTGRLRSSRPAAAAQAIGLPAFMAAAGVSCSQRLGDIVAMGPAASEREMVALLGGSA